MFRKILGFMRFANVNIKKEEVKCVRLNKKLRVKNKMECISKPQQRNIKVDESKECLFDKSKTILKQDGRLAPAYFSPDYKYFDQLLQRVKNRTTVSILVFKELLQTSI